MDIMSFDKHTETTQKMYVKMRDNDRVPQVGDRFWSDGRVFAVLEVKFTRKPKSNSPYESNETRIWRQVELIVQNITEDLL